jgi:acyl dehydratase
MAWNKVMWEDVKESQDIGSYSMEMSAVKISGGAWATRDSNPQHHDSAFAKASGSRDIFVNIMHGEGLLCRLATDWSGPTGDVKRTRFNIRGSCCAGDTLTVSGKVIKKYVGGEGLHLVDLQVDSSTEHGAFCDAVITVALPTRADGSN